MPLFLALFVSLLPLSLLLEYLTKPRWLGSACHASRFHLLLGRPSGPEPSEVAVLLSGLGLKFLLMERDKKRTALARPSPPVVSTRTSQRASRFETTTRATVRRRRRSICIRRYCRWRLQPRHVEHSSYLIRQKTWQPARRVDHSDHCSFRFPTSRLDGTSSFPKQAAGY
jgi:hypothetical protein